MLTVTKAIQTRQDAVIVELEARVSQNVNYLLELLPVLHSRVPLNVHGSWSYSVLLSCHVTEVETDRVAVAS